jgi:hypothetical protein
MVGRERMLMQAPHKQNAEVFEREIAAWIERGDCPYCHRELFFALVYVSIHSTEFDDTCAGQGRCIPYTIPYCPTCEPSPEDKGCIHMPLFPELRSA